MTTKIAKWGNSYAVRIPKSIALKHGFKDGTKVELVDGTNNIKIKSVRKKYSLDELVAQIDPNNLPETIDWGPDVGNEILPEWKE